jgi:hypothetical protein
MGVAQDDGIRIVERRGRGWVWEKGDFGKICN